MSDECSGDSACCHSKSPAIEIIENQARLGADVRVYDPFVASVETRTGVFISVADCHFALAGADCAIFLVDPDLFREIPHGLFAGVMASPVVVDGKNRIAGGEGRGYLGIEKGKI